MTTVFVTGASSGFGAAFARRFAADGTRVVACARRADRLAALGPDVLPLVVDVRDRGAVVAAIKGLPASHAAIDILVNNAGRALGLEPAYRADLDDWEQMLDTNCRGLMNCTHAILPGMVSQQRGHIINIGSTAATYPYPGGNVYGATKAFVRQFSLNLRSDLHGTGVRVTCVEPGMVGGTEFSVVRFGGDAGRAGQLYDGMVPLTADDIAEGGALGRQATATRQCQHHRADAGRAELRPVSGAPPAGVTGPRHRPGGMAGLASPG